MIVGEVTVCPNCGGDLKYYDRVKRKTIGAFGIAKFVYISRYRCIKCGKLHRQLVDLVPYKHYESWIIFSVIENTITIFSYGFEDFPCELTMKNWKKSSDKILRYKTT